ncbi:MAG: hypothetical protein ACT6QU_12465 [Aliihoeflea sp.]|uniref:hypothetical protein n=1 Tax=Aliihoeflea sp. TaxID=2608088 RepID=UPI004037D5A4
MTTSNDTTHPNLIRIARAVRRKRKSVSAVTDNNEATPDIPSGRADRGIRIGVSGKVGSAINIDADALGGRPSSRMPANSASSRTPVNDNESVTTVLRRAGNDAAVVIGLALRHVRLGRDVPFPIVCVLHRHAEAGDGAARATVDLIRRRIERRQRQKFEAYVARGLRSASLPGPHGCTTEPPGSPKRSSTGGRSREGAPRLSLVAVCDGLRNEEVGK